MSPVRSATLALLVTAVSATALAQPVVPDPGPFDDGMLPTAAIEIHPDTLAAILAPDNAESDVEYRATFTWAGTHVAVVRARAADGPAERATRRLTVVR